MGCTSSAPTTLSANPSKEDKSIQFQEDFEETNSKHVETIDNRSENEIDMKVLPPSDPAEPVHLVRNYKSSTSLELEKDLNTNGHIVENESSESTKESNDEENNDKMSKLKLEVLGKFIEITQQDTNYDNDIMNSNTDMIAEFLIRKDEETVEKAETECHENDEERENNSEETEEASPSLSQSSHATRWEALADIAAELPPSLAVDPITGQIYSLSK